MSILACGAWLKNTACLLHRDGVDWSALHGDLGDPDACSALAHAAQGLLARRAEAVEAVAHDLHPDFFSSQLAQELARELKVPAIAVQHHHAHIGAVLAEHGREGPVLGLALDGVGLGTDGAAWGGELLWVDGASWRRLGHLQPLALPGGDVAAREPWRMAAAALHALGRTGEVAARFGPAAGVLAARTVQAMLQKNLHCPPSSGAGRWFDAAAGALGVSVRQPFEAQAAMALERLAADYLDQHAVPPSAALYAIADDGTLDLRPVLAALFELGADAQGMGAALFHLTLAEALAHWAGQAARRHGVATVALGGGCFYNRIVTARLRAALQAQGLQVLLPQSVSCGDAGLALGQAWVARRQLDAAHRAPATLENKEKASCV